jgi:importin-5
MLESLAECAAEAGELVRDHLTAMLETFKVLLTESLERRAERNKRAGTDDFDEEEMQALEEEQTAEDEVFDQFAECVGSLLKAFHSAILPALEPLLGFIVPLLDKKRSPAERRIAICVFDDIFEHASDGGAAIKYLEGFVTPCIEGCTDADADVRQASVYGVGVMAEHCGMSFSNYVQHALQALASVIQAPGSRDDAKVILPSWLANLPLTEDKVEARNVHAQLMRLLETNATALLGASQEHLPRVVSVLADVLPTSGLSAKLRLVEPEVAARMKNFLLQIQSSLPQEKLAAAWSVLSAEKQAALQNALAS